MQKMSIFVMCLLVFFICSCSENNKKKNSKTESSLKSGYNQKSTVSITNGLVKEQTIIDDLQENAYEIKNYVLEIYDFEIEKRMTNENEKEDIVYVLLRAKNDDFDGNFAYKVTYYKYNDGWRFEEYEDYKHETWDSKPLHGIDESYARLNVLNEIKNSDDYTIDCELIESSSDENAINNGYLIYSYCVKKQYKYAEDVIYYNVFYSWNQQTYDWTINLEHCEDDDYTDWKLDGEYSGAHLNELYNYEYEFSLSIFESELSEFAYTYYISETKVQYSFYEQQYRKDEPKVLEDTGFVNFEENFNGYEVVIVDDYFKIHISKNKGVYEVVVGHSKIPIINNSQINNTNTDSKNISLKGADFIKNGVIGNDVDSAIIEIAKEFDMESDLGGGEYREADVFNYVSFNNLPMNILLLGANFSSIQIDYDPSSTEKGMVFSISFYVCSNDRAPSLSVVKEEFDSVYNVLESTFSEPDEIDNENSWDGEYLSRTWSDTPYGEIWLCFGTNLWGIEGNDNCILVFSDLNLRPKRS